MTFKNNCCQEQFSVGHGDGHGDGHGKANLLAYDRSFAEADAEFAKAIELDPNEADTWATLSDTAVLAGRVEEGLEHIRKAFRLNPFPASWYYLTLGQAQYAAGEYEAAVETLRRDETYRTSSRRFLAASLARATKHLAQALVRSWSVALAVCVQLAMHRPRPNPKQRSAELDRNVLETLHGAPFRKWLCSLVE